MMLKLLAAIILVGILISPAHAQEPPVCVDGVQVLDAVPGQFFALCWRRSPVNEQITAYRIYKYRAEDPFIKDAEHIWFSFAEDLCMGIECETEKNLHIDEIGSWKIKVTAVQGIKESERGSDPVFVNVAEPAPPPPGKVSGCLLKL